MTASPFFHRAQASQDAPHDVGLGISPADGRSGNSFHIGSDAEFLADRLGMDLGLRCSDERADARFLHGLEHGNDAVESPVLELADRAVAFLEIGISLAGFPAKSIDVFKGRQQAAARR